MILMVAIWDHIVPIQMETVQHFVLLIAENMTHIATMAMMITAVTWEVIVLLDILWEISNAWESAPRIVVKESRGVRTLQMLMGV